MVQLMSCVPAAGSARTCGPQPDCELALQRRRCINATEGLLLSKPIPVSANAAFFCNRYKIVDGGTKVGQLHPHLWHIMLPGQVEAFQYHLEPTAVWLGSES